jgi:hypothetical protein
MLCAISLTGDEARWFVFSDAFVGSVDGVSRWGLASFMFEIGSVAMAHQSLTF